MTETSTVAKPRFLITALALSLVLNFCALCAVGAFIFMHMRWEGSRHVERMVKLHPEQQMAFSEFRRALCDGRIALDDQNRPLLRQAWDELVRDNPDPAKVQSAFDQMV